MTLGELRKAIDGLPDWLVVRLVSEFSDFEYDVNSTRETGGQFNLIGDFSDQVDEWGDPVEPEGGDDDN